MSATRRRRQVIRLHFTDVGRASEPYPDWIRALHGVSGVYAIRERDDRGVPMLVYVGESHTRRLYETLTRHWQTWRRHGLSRRMTSHDPGVSYARDLCQAAAVVTADDVAPCLQDAFIDYLSPRDNLIRATASLGYCAPVNVHVDATPVSIVADDTPF